MLGMNATKNILKFELHKLLRQKSFYICSAIVIMLPVLFIVLVKIAGNAAGNLGSLLATVVMSEIFSGQSFALCAIKLANFTSVFGIFVVLFVCTDYENQTIKNIYSRGFSRSKVYLFKWIICMCVAVVVFILTVLMSYIFGSIVFGNNAQSGNYFGLICGQLVVVLGYSTFIFFLSSSFRRVGISIAFLILGPLVIDIVFSLFDTLLKIDGFTLSSYWFSSFETDLIDLDTSTTRLWIGIGFSIAYAVLFTFLGLLVTKKQEC